MSPQSDILPQTMFLWRHLGVNVCASVRVMADSLILKSFQNY